MERWLSGLKRMFGVHVGYCPPGFESLPLRKSVFRKFLFALLTLDARLKFERVFGAKIENFYQLRTKDFFYFWF